MSASQQALLTVTGALQPVSGMLVWLKADSVSGNDGDAIGTWSDLSGNANDFTQATAGAKPLLKNSIINGHKTIRFDGTDDTMQAAGSIASTTATVFLAWRTITLLGAYASVFSNESTSSGNGWSFLVKSNSTSAFYWLNSGGTGPAYDGSGNDSYAAGVTYIDALRWDATAGTHRWNNLAKGSWGAETGSMTPAGMRIASSFFAGRFMGCDIAEILMYNTKLSDSDQTANEAYLNSRYAAF